MNDAERMLEGWSEEKWQKGPFYRDLADQSRVCMIGRLEQLGMEYLGNPMLRVVREVIGEQFPDRRGRNEPGNIPAFNDHEDTTWDDVRLVLQKTSVRLNEAI